MKLARQALGALCYFGGLVTLVRSLKPRRGAVILMGHRVRDDEDAYFGGIPPRTFARQIRYLASRYRPLSLSELLDHVRERSPVPDNSFVLTFDDGWRDNYTEAFPVLREHGVPAMIYLVSRSIDTGELPWPQRIGWVLQHASVEEVTLPAPIGRSFALRSDGDRRRALAAIKACRETLGLDELEGVADELAERCGVEPPRDRMLTWDQVREMRRHGIEFGAHTVSHPLMARLTPEQARWQFEEAKRVIERGLGETVRHFAFPAGSCNGELIAMAREVGFESLYVRDRTRRVNDHNTSPWALTRLGATSDPVPAMATELAGIFDWLRQAVR